MYSLAVAMERDGRTNIIQIILQLKGVRRGAGIQLIFQAGKLSDKTIL